MYKKNAAATVSWIHSPLRSLLTDVYVCVLSKQLFQLKHGMPTKKKKKKPHLAHSRHLSLTSNPKSVQLDP